MNLMKRNLGDYDIAIRIIAGMCLMVLFVVNYQQYPLSWVLFPLSGILLVTGITGSCPLYRILHLNTRLHRNRKTPLG